MEKTLTAHKKPKAKIPRQFIYEEIDGMPIYYKGYREAMTENKSVEHITGCSELQATLASVILRFLYKNLDDASYFIVTGEPGLHLAKRNNLSADIAIYDKAVLKDRKPQKKYFDIPPLVNIEIDTDADLSDFENPLNYYHTKTQKLLDFGVQQVIWFFTDSRKVTVAYPQKAWMTMDWNHEIELFEKYSFSLTDLLDKGDIRLD